MSCFFAIWCYLGVGLAMPFQAGADGQDQPPARAQTDEPESAAGRSAGSSPEAQPASNDEPREHLTAEDVLKALLRQRPENRVISPAGIASWRGPAAAWGNPGGGQALMPEGSMVTSASGTVVHNGRWWTFVFDDRTDVASMKLLPNAALDPMVRTVRGTDLPPRFELSGELTVFMGENYLLPTVAMRTAEVATVSEVASDADPEDVLKRLQDQRPTREAVSMRARPVDSGPGRGSSTARTLLPDGSPLVERPGRLIRRGEWWTFVFESDHPDHPEPPIRLLPGRCLELMVQAAEGGTSGLVFIISGQVTLFENENYLLPRSARRRIDSGNLGR